MKDYRAVYEEWLTDPYYDEETKKELQAISKDEEEIKDRFYRELEFGTAGLRGIIGAGTNRMNKYVVRKATQGLANYILKQGRTENSVVIAYDSRHMSPEFSEEAACTLAANGIKAYRFESLRPTPELSFAVRELGCIAGINITASHNPARYNGYKVYWEDGAQFTEPHDEGVTKEVLAVTDMDMCRTMTPEEARAKGLYVTLDREIDDRYIACVKTNVIDGKAIEENRDKVTIVYTPFHGAGHVPVMRILKELGFEHVYEVPEQAQPDPDFTTVPYPNPEVDENYTLALALAQKVGADVIMATDPDSDRLGIYGYDSKSRSYIRFNGNMSGVLLGAYIIRRLSEFSKLPVRPEAVRSIVTTHLLDAVAKDYGVKLTEVLTGCKWIGRVIHELEKENRKEDFVFGMEESDGCLIGTFARDKDAVSACAMMAEAAAWYKGRGMTLWDAMVELYEKYGWYMESTTAGEYPGAEGQEKMKAIVEKLRRESPLRFGSMKVLEIKDYSVGTVRCPETGETGTIGLPKTNAIYFGLEKDAWVCVRPSGTEPKIKIYTGVCGKSPEEANRLIKELDEAIADALK